MFAACILESELSLVCSGPSSAVVIEAGHGLDVAEVGRNVRKNSMVFHVDAIDVVSCDL
jgi:cysteine sulfinate desulfinase/cysteine desulfurase-like protein